MTFTFTDTKATNGRPTRSPFAVLQGPVRHRGRRLTGTTATIKYTTDGMGSNFKTSLDGKDTEAAGYKASDVHRDPADGHRRRRRRRSDESADLAVANAETGSEITVSVDNGALILEPGETKLSEGSSSITDAVDGGALPPVTGSSAPSPVSSP